MKFPRLPLILPLILLAALPAPDLAAQESGAQGQYRIEVVTIGPGDELYSWWGHAGIVITDTLSDQGYFFDFGLFSFAAENFYQNFAFGRLWFEMGQRSREFELKRYLRQNRSIYVQYLDLPAEGISAIVDALREMYRPENRRYLYDHYYDNCATRIRDMVDLGIGGQLESSTGTAGTESFRSLTRMFSWHHPLVDLFLGFLMGSPIDEPVSDWNSMFLPAELRRVLDKAVWTDRNGERHTLVVRTETLNIDEIRPGGNSAPGRYLPRFLLIGLLAALPMAVLAMSLRKRHSRLLLRLYGVYVFILSLVPAVLGSLLFFMMFFTDHAFSYGNWNLLFVNPLFWFSSGVSALMIVRGRDLRRPIGLQWSLNGALMLAFALLRIIYPHWQHNEAVMVLLAPLFLVQAALLITLTLEKRSGRLTVSNGSGYED